MCDLQVAAAAPQAVRDVPVGPGVLVTGLQTEHSRQAYIYS